MVRFGAGAVLLIAGSAAYAGLVRVAVGPVPQGLMAVYSC